MVVSLVTNTKMHMVFQLVPKSVTLNGVMAITLHYSAKI